MTDDMAQVYYSEVGQTYSVLVAHNCDLTDEENEYFGLFEYSFMREDNGEWGFVIFDIFEDEVLDLDEIEGEDTGAISDLTLAMLGFKDYVDIVDSDYYDRLSAYGSVMNDPVLRESVGAYARED